MAANAKLGPVMVVNGDTAVGLAVIRSLGRRGVETHTSIGISKALGQYSRYAAGVVRLPEHPEEAVQTLSEYCRSCRATHLMAVSDDSISTLNRRRECFEPDVCLTFPRQEVFHRSLYKDRTLEIAERCGIPTPKTLVPRTMAEAEAYTGLRFPVILKPRHRDNVCGIQPVFSMKAERAATHGEMVTKLRRYEGKGELPIVQEFVPGCGIGVSALIRNGEPLCLAQHRRLREYPPSGGVSVYCESMRTHPELVERSLALLRAMQWEGVAMVEYRYDEDSGTYWLMEVNGRFWGSLPLALHAGADFPYLLYRSFFERMECRHAKPGIRARSLTADTKWLIRVLRDGGTSGLRAVSAYIRAFHPATEYYVWAADDPKPAVMKFLNRFRVL